MKIPDGDHKLVRRVFRDLPPFSITIREPGDAMFLSSACLLLITGGNTEDARTLLLNLGQYAMATSVEEAVTFTFDKANECGHKIPTFVRPMMKLMLQHMFDKKEEIMEEIKNKKEVSDETET